MQDEQEAASVSFTQARRRFEQQSGGVDARAERPTTGGARGEQAQRHRDDTPLAGHGEDVPKRSFTGFVERDGTQQRPGMLDVEMGFHKVTDARLSSNSRRLHSESLLTVSDLGELDGPAAPNPEAKAGHDLRIPAAEDGTNDRNSSVLPSHRSTPGIWNTDLNQLMHPRNTVLRSPALTPDTLEQAACDDSSTSSAVSTATRAPPRASNPGHSGADGWMRSVSTALDHGSPTGSLETVPVTQQRRLRTIHTAVASNGRGSGYSAIKKFALQAEIDLHEERARLRSRSNLERESSPRTSSVRNMWMLGTTALDDANTRETDLPLLDETIGKGAFDSIHVDKVSCSNDNLAQRCPTLPLDTASASLPFDTNGDSTITAVHDKRMPFEAGEAERGNIVGRPETNRGTVAPSLYPHQAPRSPSNADPWVSSAAAAEPTAGNMNCYSGPHDSQDLSNPPADSLTRRHIQTSRLFDVNSKSHEFNQLTTKPTTYEEATAAAKTVGQHEFSSADTISLDIPRYSTSSAAETLAKSDTRNQAATATLPVPVNDQSSDAWLVRNEGDACVTSISSRNDPRQMYNRSMLYSSAGAKTSPHDDLEVEVDLVKERARLVSRSNPGDKSIRSSSSTGGTTGITSFDEVDPQANVVPILEFGMVPVEPQTKSKKMRSSNADHVTGRYPTPLDTTSTSMPFGINGETMPAIALHKNLIVEAGKSKSENVVGRLVDRGGDTTVPLACRAPYLEPPLPTNGLSSSGTAEAPTAMNSTVSGPSNDQELVNPVTGDLPNKYMKTLRVSGMSRKSNEFDQVTTTPTASHEEASAAANPGDERKLYPVEAISPDIPTLSGSNDAMTPANTDTRNQAATISVSIDDQGTDFELTRNESDTCVMTSSPDGPRRMYDRNVLYPATGMKPFLRDEIEVEVDLVKERARLLSRSKPGDQSFRSSSSTDGIWTTGMTVLAETPPPATVVPILEKAVGKGTLDCVPVGSLAPQTETEKISRPNADHGTERYLPVALETVFASRSLGSDCSTLFEDTGIPATFTTNLDKTIGKGTFDSVHTSSPAPQKHINAKQSPNADDPADRCPIIIFETASASLPLGTIKGPIPTTTPGKNVIHMVDEYKRELVVGTAVPALEHSTIYADINRQPYLPSRPKPEDQYFTISSDASGIRTFGRTIPVNADTLDSTAMMIVEEQETIVKNDCPLPSSMARSVRLDDETDLKASEDGPRETLTTSGDLKCGVRVSGEDSEQAIDLPKLDHGVRTTTTGSSVVVDALISPDTAVENTNNDPNMADNVCASLDTGIMATPNTARTARTGVFACSAPKSYLTGTRTSVCVVETAVSDLDLNTDIQTALGVTPDVDAESSQAIQFVPGASGMRRPTCARANSAETLPDGVRLAVPATESPDFKPTFTTLDANELIRFDPANHLVGSPKLKVDTRGDRISVVECCPLPSLPTQLKNPASPSGSGLAAVSSPTVGEMNTEVEEMMEQALKFHDDTKETVREHLTFLEVDKSNSQVHPCTSTNPEPFIDEECNADGLVNQETKAGSATLFLGKSDVTDTGSCVGVGQLSGPEPEVEYPRLPDVATSAGNEIRNATSFRGVAEVEPRLDCADVIKESASNVTAIGATSAKNMRATTKRPRDTETTTNARLESDQVSISYGAAAFISHDRALSTYTSPDVDARAPTQKLNGLCSSNDVLASDDTTAISIAVEGIEEGTTDDAMHFSLDPCSSMADVAVSNSVRELHQMNNCATVSSDTKNTFAVEFSGLTETKEAVQVVGQSDDVPIANPDHDPGVSTGTPFVSMKEVYTSFASASAKESVSGNNVPKSADETAAASIFEGQDTDVQMDVRSRSDAKISPASVSDGRCNKSNSCGLHSTPTVISGIGVPVSTEVTSFNPPGYSQAAAIVAATSDHATAQGLRNSTRTTDLQAQAKTTKTDLDEILNGDWSKSGASRDIPFATLSGKEGGVNVLFRAVAKSNQGTNSPATMEGTGSFTDPEGQGVSGSGNSVNETVISGDTQTIVSTAIRKERKLNSPGALPIAADIAAATRSDLDLEVTCSPLPLTLSEQLDTRDGTTAKSDGQVPNLDQPHTGFDKTRQVTQDPSAVNGIKSAESLRIFGSVASAVTAVIRRADLKSGQESNQSREFKSVVILNQKAKQTQNSIHTAPSDAVITMETTRDSAMREIAWPRAASIGELGHVDLDAEEVLMSVNTKVPTTAIFAGLYDDTRGAIAAAESDESEGSGKSTANSADWLPMSNPPPSVPKKLELCAVDLEGKTTRESYQGAGLSPNVSSKLSCVDANDIDLKFSDPMTGSKEQAKKADQVKNSFASPDSKERTAAGRAIGERSTPVLPGHLPMAPNLSTVSGVLRESHTSSDLPRFPVVAATTFSADVGECHLTDSNRSTKVASASVSKAKRDGESKSSGMGSSQPRMTVDLEGLEEGGPSARRGKTSQETTSPLGAAIDEMREIIHGTGSQTYNTIPNIPLDKVEDESDSDSSCSFYSASDFQTSIIPATALAFSEHEPPTVVDSQAQDEPPSIPAHDSEDEGDSDSSASFFSVSGFQTRTTPATIHEYGESEREALSPRTPASHIDLTSSRSTSNSRYLTQPNDEPSACNDSATSGTPGLDYKTKYSNDNVVYLSESKPDPSASLHVAIGSASDNYENISEAIEGSASLRGTFTDEASNQQPWDELSAVTCNRPATHVEDRNCTQRANAAVVCGTSYIVSDYGSDNETNQYPSVLQIAGSYETSIAMMPGIQEDTPRTTDEPPCAVTPPVEEVVCFGSHRELQRTTDSPKKSVSVSETHNFVSEVESGEFELVTDGHEIFYEKGRLPILTTASKANFVSNDPSDPLPFADSAGVVDPVLHDQGKSENGAFESLQRHDTEGCFIDEAEPMHYQIPTPDAMGMASSSPSRPSAGSTMIQDDEANDTIAAYISNPVGDMIETSDESSVVPSDSSKSPRKSGCDIERILEFDSSECANAPNFVAGNFDCPRGPYLDNTMSGRVGNLQCESKIKISLESESVLLATHAGPYDTPEGAMLPLTERVRESGVAPGSHILFESGTGSHGTSQATLALTTSKTSEFRGVDQECCEADSGGSTRLGQAPQTPSRASTANNTLCESDIRGSSNGIEFDATAEAQEESKSCVASIGPLEGSVAHETCEMGSPRNSCVLYSLSDERQIDVTNVLLIDANEGEKYFKTPSGEIQSAVSSSHETGGNDQTTLFQGKSHPAAGVVVIETGNPVTFATAGLTHSDVVIDLPSLSGANEALTDPSRIETVIDSSEPIDRLGLSDHFTSVIYSAPCRKYSDPQENSTGEADFSTTTAFDPIAETVAAQSPAQASAIFDTTHNLPAIVQKGKTGPERATSEIPKSHSIASTVGASAGSSRQLSYMNDEQCHVTKFNGIDPPSETEPTTGHDHRVETLDGLAVVRINKVSIEREESSTRPPETRHEPQSGSSRVATTTLANYSQFRVDARKSDGRANQLDLIEFQNTCLNVGAHQAGLTNVLVSRQLQALDHLEQTGLDPTAPNLVISDTAEVVAAQQNYAKSIRKGCGQPKRDIERRSSTDDMVCQLTSSSRCDTSDSNGIPIAIGELGTIIGSSSGLHRIPSATGRAGECRAATCTTPNVNTSMLIDENAQSKPTSVVSRHELDVLLKESTAKTENIDCDPTDKGIPSTEKRISIPDQPTDEPGKYNLATSLSGTLDTTTVGVGKHDHLVRVINDCNNRSTLSGDCDTDDQSIISPTRPLAQEPQWNETPDYVVAKIAIDRLGRLDALSGKTVLSRGDESNQSLISPRMDEKSGPSHYFSSAPSDVLGTVSELNQDTNVSPEFHGPSKRSGANSAIDSNCKETSNMSDCSQSDTTKGPSPAVILAAMKKTYNPPESALDTAALAGRETDRGLLLEEILYDPLIDLYTDPRDNLGNLKLVFNATKKSEAAMASFGPATSPEEASNIARGVVAEPADQRVEVDPKPTTMIPPETILNGGRKGALNFSNQTIEVAGVSETEAIASRDRQSSISHDVREMIPWGASTTENDRNSSTSDWEKSVAAAPTESADYSHIHPRLRPSRSDQANEHCALSAGGENEAEHAMSVNLDHPSPCLAEEMRSSNTPGNENIKSGPEVKLLERPWAKLTTDGTRRHEFSQEERTAASSGKTVDASIIHSTEVKEESRPVPITAIATVRMDIASVGGFDAVPDFQSGSEAYISPSNGASASTDPTDVTMSSGQPQVLEEPITVNSQISCATNQREEVGRSNLFHAAAGIVDVASASGIRSPPECSSGSQNRTYGLSVTPCARESYTTSAVPAEKCTLEVDSIAAVIDTTHSAAGSASGIGNSQLTSNIGALNSTTGMCIAHETSSMDSLSTCPKLLANTAAITASLISQLDSTGMSDAIETRREDHGDLIVNFPHRGDSSARPVIDAAADEFTDAGTGLLEQGSDIAPSPTVVEDTTGAFSLVSGFTESSAPKEYVVCATAVRRNKLAAVAEVSFGPDDAFHKTNSAAGWIREFASVTDVSSSADTGATWTNCSSSSPGPIDNALAETVAQSCDSRGGALAKISPASGEEDLSRPQVMATTAHYSKTEGDVPERASIADRRRSSGLVEAAELSIRCDTGAMANDGVGSCNSLVEGKTARSRKAPSKLAGRFFRHFFGKLRSRRLETSAAVAMIEYQRGVVGAREGMVTGQEIVQNNTGIESAPAVDEVAAAVETIATAECCATANEPSSRGSGVADRDAAAPKRRGGLARVLLGVILVSAVKRRS